MSNNVDLGQIKQSIEELADSVKKQAKAAGSRLNDATDSGKEKVSQLKNTVEKNPLAAVGIAAVVGWVVGRLFKRSHKD
jgi:ElaB/YqjD/DUF883 family membrane-anchored ribosome-binding protein